MYKLKKRVYQTFLEGFIPPPLVYVPGRSYQQNSVENRNYAHTNKKDTM